MWASIESLGFTICVGQRILGLCVLARWSPETNACLQLYHLGISGLEEPITASPKQVISAI